MNITICNKKLSLTVSSFGAEMQSILFEGKEYLWQGDPAYWAERAPVLFPFVGRFTDGLYRYQGNDYPMTIHGFAKLNDFTLIESDESFICFRLTDSVNTYGSYPFHFDLTVIYRIEDNRIAVTYQVKNNNNHTMYFAIGAHPGFRVPLEDGLSFTDYCLEFKHSHVPTRVGHTEACFLSGIDKDFPLEDNIRLSLHHDLFDEDAIVLKNVSNEVTLKSAKGKRCVTVSYPDLPYLGIWHAPHTDATYVCIEPWTSLPSRQDIVEDFECKSDMIRLKENGVYQNTWYLTFR